MSQTDKQRFCSLESRLFSGDPSALFAEQSDYQNVSTTLDAPLSSPYSFVLDTSQVPATEFWHIPKLQVMVYDSQDPLNNYAGRHNRIFLCPPSMFGSSQPPGNIDVNKIGIELRKKGGGFIQNPVVPWGLAILDIETPIEVPPNWFIRYMYVDNGGGPGDLPAGAQLFIRFQRQVIQVGFNQEY